MENAFLPRLAWDTSQLFRKSLTSLRALTLLLVMCLSIGNVWGDDTITINYGDTFNPTFPTSGGNTEATAHVDKSTDAKNFAFKEMGIYKGGSSSYLMFVQNKGYLYNTTSLGTIVKVSVTYSSGCSTSAKAGVYFGSSEQSTYTTTSNATIKGQSKTDEWTNSTSSNGFFQLSTSNKNTQITKIEIIYSNGGGSSVDPPSFSPNGGTFTSAQTVTLSTKVANATIYYTTDESDPTESQTAIEYTNPIAVNQTTTIKAVVMDENLEFSDAITKTYTILTPLTTMDAIFEAATTAGSSATDVAVTFNNWVISGIALGTTSKNAYLTDGTKGLIIYNNSGHGFAIGDQLSGTVMCKVQLYNGAAELTEISKSKAGLTVTEGGSLTPQVVSIVDMGGVNTGAVVTVNSVVYNADAKTLTDANSNVIKPYATIYSGAITDLIDTKTYNYTGVYMQYNDTKEIMARSNGDIQMICSNIVDVSKAETTHGSFEVSHAQVCGDDAGGEVTVTPTPDPNYEVSQVTATVGTVGDPVEGVYTVSGITAATTISVTFAEKASANISWSFQGAPIEGGSTKVYVGDKVATLPTIPEYDCNGKVFVGWSNQTVTDGNKPGVLFKYADAAPAIAAAGNITYYAVFATIQSGSTEPQTVTWNINGVATPASGGNDVNTALSTSSIVPNAETGVWTAVASSSYAATSSQKAQLGSGSYAFNGTITLSGSAIPSTANILQVDLTATSSAADANPYSVSATVGGVAFSSTKSLSSGSANCQWLGETVGNTIMLTTQCSAKKNIVISGLSVQYNTAVYSDYATTCEFSPYTISNTLSGCTADAGNPESFARDAEYVTLNYTLNSGYTWGTPSITMGGEDMSSEDFTLTTEGSNGELLMMPDGGFTGNLAITLTCIQSEPIVIMLMDTEEEAEVAENLAYLPDRTCKNTNYTFVGWSETDCGTTDTETTPTIIETDEGYVEVSKSMNLWPVFKRNDVVTKWVKTAASAVEAGVYAVITTDGHAFNGTITSGHGQITSMTFAFTNDTAVSAPEGTLEITMQAVTGGFTMYNASKGYLYASKASSGGLAWHDSESAYWSFASDNWRYSVQYDSKYAYLRDYQNATIRTYATNSGSVIQFAKKASVDKTYYNRKPANEVAAPELSSAEGPFFGSTEVTITDAQGNAIYYTLDGTTPTASSTPYEGAITLTETKTVKAIAIDEDDYSSPVASATYTINPAFTSIEALVSGATVDQPVQLTIENAYVHAIQSTTGNDLIYLQKGDRGIVLSNTSDSRPEGLEVGKQLTAVIRGIYKVSAGREQINTYTLFGEPTISAGTRPTEQTVTALGDELMSRHLGLIKMENLYPQSKSGNLITMNTQADGQGTDIKLWNVLSMVKNLPDNTVKCNVTGLFYRRIVDSETTYTIMPVLENDFVVIDPQAATLPTVNPAGGATVESAVSVPMGQVVTITPIAGYTTYYTLKGGEEQQITAKAEITLDKDTFISIRATRDYYTESTATHYYHIDQSQTAHNVNAPGVGNYKYSTDKASAVQGEIVTLTITPNTHWYVDSVKAAYNVSDSIKCTSLGDNQYTFEMPNADVNIRVFTHKDPTYTVKYYKGSASSVTGDDPADKSYYENDEVTIVANPWTADGYNFTGWVVTYNNGEEDVVITPIEGKFSMPPYAVKITAQWEELIWHKSGAWILVTNVNDLAVGDYVIFADTLASDNKAGGTTQNKDNRGTVSVTFQHDTLTFETSPAKFQIEAGNVSNTFSFYEQGAGYIYAVGQSDKNYMRTTADKTTAGASWTIAIAANGSATVLGNVDSRNMLQINGTVFSAYGSKQKGLAIYKFYQTSRIVYFDANAGEDVVTNMPDKQRADVTTHKVTISDKTPLRTGYTFSKWNSNTSGTGVHSANPGEEITLWEASSNLHAIWTINQYNLAVAAIDNITIAAKLSDETTIAEGENANLDYKKQVTLTKSDLSDLYVFQSWKVTKADDETVVVDVVDNKFNMPAFAVNVTAVLEEKASAKRYLTYNGNGGTLIDPSTPIEHIEYAYGTTINPLAGAIFEKPHCVFTGWNTKADGTGKGYVSQGQLTITEDVTLYAQWKGLGATYTVESITSVSVTDGQAPTGSTATFVNTYSSNKYQLTENNSMTLTLSGYAGKVITGVSFSTKSNSGAGAGTYEVKVGNRILGSVTGTYKDIWGAWSSAFETQVLPITQAYVENGEDVVIKISATASSLYCQSFTIEFAEPDYTRTISGTYGTICLNHGVDAGNLLGGTFYEGEYLLMDGSDPYKYYLTEVDHLEAGYPYVYVANSGAQTIAVLYNDTKNNTAQSKRGLIGTFSDIMSWESDGSNALTGYYMIINDQFRLCGIYCGLYANRAYLDVNAGDLPRHYTEQPAPVGKRRLVLTNQGHGTPTAIDNLTEEGVRSSSTDTLQKVMIDGSLYIIRGEKVYDAQGKLVK